MEGVDFMGLCFYDEKAHDVFITGDKGI